MPHVSKGKLNQKVLKDLESYIRSVVAAPTNKQRASIFDELLTQTEKVMLAKRLGILFLLKKGFSLYKISKILKISSSTAERFRLEYEIGKYKHTISWIQRQTREGSFDDFMEKLVALAFTGKTKSFKKFIEDY